MSARDDMHIDKSRLPEILAAVSVFIDLIISIVLIIFVIFT